MSRAATQVGQRRSTDQRQDEAPARRPQPVLGVKAECKSLEDIAQPLTAADPGTAYDRARLRAQRLDTRRGSEPERAAQRAVPSARSAGWSWIWPRCGEWLSTVSLRPFPARQRIGEPEPAEQKGCAPADDHAGHDLVHVTDD